MLKRTSYGEWIANGVLLRLVFQFNFFNNKIIYRMKALVVFSCLAALVVSLNACNKNSVDPTATDGSARASLITSGTATGPHGLTAVDVSSLPASITSYISTKYAGATLKKADKDAKGNYAVLITVSNTGKVLLFKADGTFVKELTDRPEHMPGDSTHHPMRGDSAHHHMPGDTTHRPKPGLGGPGLTEVATSSLPAAVTSYISTNYTGATIDKAGQEKKTADYVVIITTSAGKHVVLLFGSDGTFKKVFAGK